MKVLNLRCTNGHGFEGWFGSDEDFMTQNGVGQIECPMCADRIITRMPTAPRLSLSQAKEPVVTTPAGEGQRDGGIDMQAMWLKAVRHVMENTVDVGERFAEEARRIHYGETEHRGIRGQASQEERASLREEGIEVMALPLPAGLKGPVQ